MRVLLDECLPHDLRHALGPHQAVTAAYQRLAGISNGTLLAAAAAAGFDAIVTTDHGMEHQQNPKTLPLTIYLLHASSNELDDVLVAVPALLRALATPPATPRLVHVRP